MEKSADAYRTISEVAEELKLPQHVLRFWETRFPQVKPMKRGGNRRFYTPGDVELLRAIKTLLYGDGFTIKGVQRILKEQGPRAVASLAQSGQLRSPVASKATDHPHEVPYDAAGSADASQGASDARAARPLPAPNAREDQAGREPPTPAEATADECREAAPGPVDLRGSLQAVLFELSECERVLAAAAG